MPWAQRRSFLLNNLQNETTNFDSRGRNIGYRNIKYEENLSKLIALIKAKKPRPNCHSDNTEEKSLGQALCRYVGKNSSRPATKEKLIKEGGDYWFRELKSYDEAQKFVQKQGWKTLREFRQNNNSSITKIPTNVEICYKNNGWTTSGDFFGTNRVANAKRIMRSFEDARTYMHDLKIEMNSVIYSTWIGRPSDIPIRPDLYYNDEWTNWPDYLATA